MNRNKIAKPRVFEVKVLLNEDEFNEFDTECAQADVKHSPNLRRLAKDWIARQRNDRAARSRAEWPPAGQNMAMLLPGRANFSMPRYHMRA